MTATTMKKKHEISAMTHKPIHGRPVAAEGLTSYRARGRFSWIMIGARDHAEAMNEARRSTPDPRDLEVWDGTAYVPVEAGRDNDQQ